MLMVTHSCSKFIINSLRTKAATTITIGKDGHKKNRRQASNSEINIATTSDIPQDQGEKSYPSARQN